MLNDKFLSENKLNTNPKNLMFQSYDSYDIENDKIPIDSICSFTISGLKHVFPLIKIELSDKNEIIVEDNLIGISAIPNKNHVDYIKEIMLDIFLLFQNDETKIPKSMYKWYYEN